MYEVRRQSAEELQQAFRDEVAWRCAVAFAAECRLAILVRSIQQCALTYEFIVLSPGERPPGKGWTIFEDRGGVAVERPM